MIAKWKALGEVPDEEKQHLFFAVDAFLRDSQAKKTYRK